MDIITGEFVYVTNMYTRDDKDIRLSLKPDDIVDADIWLSEMRIGEITVRL